MPDEAMVGDFRHPYRSIGSLDRVTAALIRENIRTGDPEYSHVKADEILVWLLAALGFQETVKAFEEVPKWYS